MTTEFTQFDLLPGLEQAVVELGYQTPMPIQAELIPVMMTGKDVIGQAQTGTGKTAAFALPILQHIEPGHGFVQSLVLVPTRELALQVANAFTQLSRHMNVRVLAVYGGQAYGPQIGQIRRGLDVIVGTPGRLLDLLQKGILDLSQVRTVVLDEADEMLSMGFVEDIEAILAETPEQRQTALFSATMPREIRQLADRYMNDPQAITIQRAEMTGESIEQRYYLVNREDKLAALTRLFEMEDISSALVFVRTRSAAGELANALSTRGYSAEALSGDLSQDARERTLNRFRQNQVKVLVATDVAARGLDIDDISHVFNFDLPDDPEVYVHRIGRTGRAGKTGIAISLLPPVEKRRLRMIEEFSKKKINRATLPTEEDIRNAREERLMQQVTKWLLRGRCKKEREMVEKLVESGYDTMEIAAAAIKLARAEEKHRPIEPVAEVQERRAPRQQSGGRSPERVSTGRYPARGLEVSHEAGMVRLSLNAGRMHGVRPNDIVGAIANHADIPGNQIGKIHIHDKHSFVDIPESLVTQVLAKSGGVYIRRQPVHVQMA